VPIRSFGGGSGKHLRASSEAGYAEPGLCLALEVRSAGGPNSGRALLRSQESGAAATADLAVAQRRSAAHSTCSRRITSKERPAQHHICRIGAGSLSRADARAASGSSRNMSARRSG
jgi:hypothetical protein